MILDVRDHLEGLLEQMGFDFLSPKRDEPLRSGIVTARHPRVAPNVLFAALIRENQRLVTRGSSSGVVKVQPPLLQHARGNGAHCRCVESSRFRYAVKHECEGIPPFLKRQPATLTSVLNIVRRCQGRVNGDFMAGHVCKALVGPVVRRDGLPKNVFH